MITSIRRPCAACASDFIVFCLYCRLCFATEPVLKLYPAALCSPLRRSSSSSASSLPRWWRPFATELVLEKLYPAALCGPLHRSSSSSASSLPRLWRPFATELFLEKLYPAATCSSACIGVHLLLPLHCRPFGGPLLGYGYGRGRALRRSRLPLRRPAPALFAPAGPVQPLSSLPPSHAHQLPALRSP